MSIDYKLAEVLDLVRHGDIECLKDRAVFYSNARNRKAAQDFCRKNFQAGFMTVTDLPLYKKLAEIPLFGSDSPFPREEAVDISALLSTRFAEAAKGNIVLFYDKVSDRSTFFTVELPVLLDNGNVTTINGVPKEAWRHLVKPGILPRTRIIEARELAFDLSRHYCP